MWFNRFMLLISPAALHIWDHLRDILRWGWFFQLIWWVPSVTKVTKKLSKKLPKNTVVFSFFCGFCWMITSGSGRKIRRWHGPRKRASCREVPHASMWPKALKMLRSMVRSSDQKSGKSAYPLTISTISFYDWFWIFFWCHLQIKLFILGWTAFCRLDTVYKFRRHQVFVADFCFQDAVCWT